MTDHAMFPQIGINPGLFAAYKGHHYAGPGNHFWKCLYLSGLTREQMSADEDYKVCDMLYHVQCECGKHSILRTRTRGGARAARSNTYIYIELSTRAAVRRGVRTI